MSPHQALTIRLPQIEASIRAKRSELAVNHDVGDHHDHIQSMESRAAASAEISRLDRDRGATKLALQRIAEGTYGICVSCEGHIADKRLERMPNATRCIPCQEATERVGRHDDLARWEDVA
jgi:RNA polymerase-binding transcription factor DksA